MFDAIRPNRTLAPTAWLILLLGQGALFLAVWAAGDVFLVPGPLDVLHAWGVLVAEQGLLHEVLVSLWVNLEAILLSTAITFVFAYLTVLPIMQPVVAFLSRTRFFGLTGFTVVLTMAVGGGHPLKVALLTFGISAFLLTSMASLVASIPKAEYDQARTLRMGEWRIVWEVVVRGTLAEALEALRQSAAIGWMMLTMVEGLSRGEGGLGVLMLNQQKHFLLSNVFAIQATIFAFGVLQDWGLHMAQRLICPYAHLTLERK